MNLIPSPKDPITSRSILALLAASLTMTLSTGMLFGILTVTEQRQDFLEQSQLAAIERMLQLGEIDGCIRVIDTLPKGFRRRSEVDRLSNICRDQLVAKRLEVARNLINQGNFEYALNLLAKLPQSAHVGEVQQRMAEICDRLLNTAQQEYVKTTPQYLNNASYPLKQIPSEAPCYDEAQVRLTQWEDESAQNQQRLKSAEIAHKQGNFEAADQELDRVSRHGYWQEKIEPLRQTLQYEPILRRAETYLKRGQLRNAIYEVQTLPDIEPWLEQKYQLIAQAEARLRMQNVCDFFTQGHWDGCY